MNPLEAGPPLAATTLELASGAGIGRRPSSLLAAERDMKRTDKEKGERRWVREIRERERESCGAHGLACPVTHRRDHDASLLQSTPVLTARGSTRPRDHWASENSVLHPTGRRDGHEVLGLLAHAP